MATRDDLSDSELLRASADDPSAFELLFARHACKIRSWLGSEVGERFANDLLAETFAQAWRSRRRFRGDNPDDGRAWLYGIARNLLKRHFKRGRIETRARERLGMRTDLFEDDDSQAVLARLDATGMRGQIAFALAGLPELQQRAVDARVVRELDYDAVATELSCSKPAARALVSRGLRRLNSVLGGEL